MRDLAAAASKAVGEGRAPNREEIGRIASKYDFHPV
jgi:hypothetical protein